jgi:hypothetical protein
MKLIIAGLFLLLSINSYASSDKFVYVSGKLLSFGKGEITYLTSNGVTKSFPRNKIIRINDERVGSLMMFQILTSDLSSGDGDGKGNQ